MYTLIYSFRMINKFEYFLSNELVIFVAGRWATANPYRTDNLTHQQP